MILPKFIRLIIYQEAELLEIPAEFIKVYSQNLPRSVHFMVPTGHQWEIQVVRSNDGEVFFGDGWKVFREYYLIMKGQFLVLEYDQKYNHFDVLIFEKNGTESRYRVHQQAGTTSEVYCYSMIDVEPPKFCLIIDNVTRDSLRIPYAFANRFNGDLPGTVFLTVLVCSWKWKVELVHKSDGEIWMHSGCKEFMDYYNIGFGHSMVFEYDGESSCFDVFIFDTTSTEIDYVPGGVEDGTELKDSDDDQESASEDDQESERNNRKLEFSKILNYHDLYTLRLDKKFVVGSGIKKGMTVMLLNGEGKKWKSATARGRYGSCKLTTGWKKFLIDNKVTVGSKMSFKCVSRDLIEARVVQSGSDELYKYVRRSSTYKWMGSHAISGHERKR